ncbi:MAG: hypothetical protein IPG07_07360 [Crocinitomicaceae bacterium]|nr:hypothetical protein [Crocinitomicaceae bacterium]
MNSSSLPSFVINLIVVCFTLLVGCHKDTTMEPPAAVDPTIIGDWKMIKRNGVQLTSYEHDSIKIYDNGVYKKVGPKKVTPTGLTQYTEYIGSWSEVNDSIIFELQSVENYWAFTGGGDSLYTLPCTEKWMVTSYDNEHLLITNLNVWNNCCYTMVFDSTNLFKRL